MSRTRFSLAATAHIVVASCLMIGCTSGAPLATATLAQPSPTPVDIVTSSPTPPPTNAPTASPDDASSAPAAQNIEEMNAFGELPPGTYWVAGEPDNTWRVQFSVRSSGWSAFLGPFKQETAEGKTHRIMTLNFFDIRNTVKDACTDHKYRDPAVGPSVDDLAEAASSLSPFVVKSAPTDVTVFGYSGKHLILEVPDVPFSVRNGQPSFAECDTGGLLKSWIGPPLSYAYYGYAEPGQTEELWILDVEGKRLTISRLSHPDSPPQDVAELNEIFESIEIYPE